VGIGSGTNEEFEVWGLVCSNRFRIFKNVKLSLFENLIGTSHDRGGLRPPTFEDLSSIAPSLHFKKYVSSNLLPLFLENLAALHTNFIFTAIREGFESDMFKTVDMGVEVLGVDVKEVRYISDDYSEGIGHYSKFGEVRLCVCVCVCVEREGGLGLLQQVKCSAGLLY
jgi:hypothetical protein